MEEKIIQILNEINENFQGYAGIDMVKDEILDSFSIMELIAELEEFYRIEIDADDIVADNFKTVDTVVALIEKYVETSK